MSQFEGIRAIFFDAAGTLLDVRGSVGEIYSRIASRYGVRSEPQVIQKAFAKAFNQMPPMAFPGLIGQDLLNAEKLWWRDVVRQVFSGRMTEALLEPYFSEVFEAFRGSETWELLPETRSVLKRLRSRGYRLGVISNFDSRLYDVLESLHILDFLECVIISSRAGAAKPDPRIFHEALAAVGLSASEALHVGDSLEADVQGALRAGLTAVLMDPMREYAVQPEICRIQNLSELCSLLDA